VRGLRGAGGAGLGDAVAHHEAVGHTAGRLRVAELGGGAPVADGLGRVQVDGVAGVVAVAQVVVRVGPLEPRPLLVIAGPADLVVRVLRILRQVPPLLHLRAGGGRGA
jgi:hypothetical protein